MVGVDTGRLRALIESLDRLDRLITLLYYADGLEPAEIAVVTNVATSRVEACLESVRVSAARLIGAAAASA